MENFKKLYNVVNVILLQVYTATDKIIVVLRCVFVCQFLIIIICFTTTVVFIIVI